MKIYRILRLYIKIKVSHYNTVYTLKKYEMLIYEHAETIKYVEK